MKINKLFTPAILFVITPPILVYTILLTSCSSSDSIITYADDNTSYSSIIQPDPAQTVTTNDELKKISQDYLNDPNKVAAD
jgi:hypothetical protein